MDFWAGTKGRTLVGPDLCRAGEIQKIALAWFRNPMVFHRAHPHQLADTEARRGQREAVIFELLGAFIGYGDCRLKASGEGWEKFCIWGSGGNNNRARLFNNLPEPGIP